MTFTDLTGQLLIAMPNMPDPRFAQSVIFLCAHSEEGAMGLIVNKYLSSMKLSELLDTDSMVEAPSSQRLPVHFGGPVENGRGFVLHSSEYSSEVATLHVNETFSMTATLDVLEEIDRGRGPDLALLTLGYSGWAPGQLEAELVQNGWLVCDATPDLVFIEKDEDKWVKALQSLGVDPLTLSHTSGTA